MTGRETALTPIKGSFKFVQGLEARAAMWRSPAIFSFSAKRSATAKYLGREMAKAKRKDPVEVEASGVSTATKRQKVVHEEKSSKSKSKKEQQSLVKSRKDGAGAAKNSEKVVTSASPPEALRIVSGSYEKVLCGIDAKFEDKSKKNNLVLNPVYMFSAHTGAIKCLATNDRYLVSGGSDEVIKIYDLKKRKDLGSLVQHSGALTALQFYSRNHLLSASEDGTICIWRTRDWECMATMKGHKGRVNGLCVHPSGKIAVSVGKDRALRLWNLMTGRKASANKLGEEAFDVKWNAAGDHYAIMFDRKIVVYDMQATAVLTIQHSVRIHCIRYFQHPVHGETILAGLDDKLIRFYSPSDGKVLQDIKGHRARVKAIDTSMVSHNGLIRVIASASSDGEVKTWIMADDGAVEESGTYDTGNRLLCLAVHDFAIEQLDTFPRLLKGESSDEFESEESDAVGEEEEEWHGIDA